MSKTRQQVIDVNAQVTGPKEGDPETASQGHSRRRSVSTHTQQVQT